MTITIDRQRLQDWTPDLLVGAMVALLGLAEVWSDGLSGAPEALGTAVAVSMFRRRPGLALALAWAVFVLMWISNGEVMLVNLSFVLIAFGGARWGSRTVVALTGVSIPIGAAATTFVGIGGVIRDIDISAIKPVFDAAIGFTNSWQLAVVFLGAAVLMVPWFAGLSLRYSARAREEEVHKQAAEADAARAYTATELARDVHDVVGHSLAVILAQAESAQYLDDPSSLKQTMANIATSARTSLQDVREVLARTGGSTPPVRPQALDELIDGVRASGHEVLSSEIGTLRPLPPELSVVAFRVLQEMLTNAIKHGRRGSPVIVERHWDGELRIEVRNVIGTAHSGAGQGVEGMRRRLEAVGGRLDVRRRDEAGGPTYTTTAWVPVRSAP
ncbi:sensor histidine kinase [Tenggerimyces flavus]|uniref:histidine kinase n=1 Tax=Tenggerimyces flavus TaxID=1708749 RepID=A0ABV7Y6L4_9ACTN|nr:histidine kinase [Tenggerimyces flavus]MBM7791275.1 signal transduction histidine kinase [Tenggerimyces flavus]